MAQLSGFGGNSNIMSAAALTADQRSRERQRLRRHGVEKREELPSFSEPRKIAVDRQDSLSNKIQNVLGDVDVVRNVIERSPNVWFGTSRTGSKNFQGDRSKTGKDGVLNKSHLSSSSGRASGLASHSSSSKFVHSNKFIEQSSTSSDPAGFYLHSNTSSSAFDATNTSSAGKSSSSKHSDNSLSVSTREAHSKPAPMSNRSRLPSMDMPAAMENIFREMRMSEVEPITAIQTPQIGDEFNFSKNQLKSKSSVESDQHEGDERNSEAHPNSESDSSDEDEDTDSEESDAEKNEEWNLTEIMKQKVVEKAEPATNSRSTPTRSHVVERNSAYKSASPGPIARTSPSSTLKEEKKRPRGRPPGPRSAAAKVGSSQSSPSLHSNQSSKKFKSISQPENNARESSRVAANTKSLQSKAVHNQAVYSNRDSKQARNPRPHDLQPPINSASPSSPPFSVKNETLSPDTPASSERHRTAKKSPRLSYVTTYSSDSSSESSVEEEISSSSDSEKESLLSTKSHVRPEPIREQRLNYDVAKSHKQGASISNKQKSSNEQRSTSYKKNDQPRHRSFKEEKSRPPSILPKSSSTARNLAAQSVHANLHVEKSSQERSYMKDSKACRVNSPVSGPEKAVSIKTFPSLWVKLPISSSKNSALDADRFLCNEKKDDKRIAGKSVQRVLSDRLLQTSRCDSTGFSVSADHFSEQSVDDIQVANSLSSSSVSPNQQRHPAKRKIPKAPTYPNKSKRRKSQTSPMPQNTNTGNSQTVALPKQTRKEAEQVKDRKNDSYSGRQWSDIPPTQQATLYSNKKFVSSNESLVNNPLSNPTLPEPDSSWPEQETRLKTSEQYMREGKRLKHEGDSYADSKTGRTRNGESLSRALLYFEASLCFLMNAFMLEVENNNERSDSSRATHSPTSMYNQTISLLEYVRKMRAHDESGGIAFKRLNISCLRTQALLFLRVFKLKKEIAGKYQDSIAEHFKANSNKPNHIPSPWHSAGHNALSPVSPAVPSPYGSSIPGPSPLASSNTACEQVSSSTQVGKMTSPPAQSGIVLAPKVHEMFKQFHTIMSSLMQAHDKWEQAESLMSEHTDFFRHVDVLRGHSLNLDNSIEDLYTYNKVILRQLQGAYKSPKD